VIRLVRRAKLFVFLREHRHELFDEAFQAELAQTYADSVKGQPPVAPAQLALATILQAYTGVSDDEVIEACVMDRRWQLALDCMDTADPPFSKGTLVGFRKRLIEANLDRRLVERTVEVAAGTKAFGARALRGALDSSPLWGAGRVEDTLNLMGHALRKALGVIACQQGRGLAATGALAHEAGAPILAGSSLKAALDVDWDDPGARDQALAVVLAALDAVETFVAGQQLAGNGAADAVGLARKIEDQDVAVSDAGGPRLRRGVAKDRRISIEDADMRHGRKSRSNLFDGYKPTQEVLVKCLVPRTGDERSGWLMTRVACGSRQWRHVFMTGDSFGHVGSADRLLHGRLASCGVPPARRVPPRVPRLYVDHQTGSSFLADDGPDSAQSSLGGGGGVALGL
jgi:transposase